MAKKLFLLIFSATISFLVQASEPVAFHAHADTPIPPLRHSADAASGVGKTAARRETAYQSIKPRRLLGWTSPEGRVRLLRSWHAADFGPLANQFEPQKNDILCGPTSSVIVLNALRGRENNEQVPTDPSTIPEQASQYLPKGFDPRYKRYTQNTFFNEATDRVKTLIQVYGEPMPATGVADYGLQLRQLHDMLLAHGLEVTMRVVDGSVSRRAMREEIRRNLGKPGDYVIINFSRKVLSQPGGGHFSPLAAYDLSSDSFLVMDTVPLTSDWFWVDAELLFDAMETFDTVENRGYLLISEGVRVQ